MLTSSCSVECATQRYFYIGSNCRSLDFTVWQQERFEGAVQVQRDAKTRVTAAVLIGEHKMQRIARAVRTPSVGT